MVSRNILLLIDTNFYIKFLNEFQFREFTAQKRFICFDINDWHYFDFIQWLLMFPEYDDEWEIWCFLYLDLRLNFTFYKYHHPRFVKVGRQKNQAKPETQVNTMNIVHQLWVFSGPHSNRCSVLIFVPFQLLFFFTSWLFSESSIFSSKFIGENK